MPAPTGVDIGSDTGSDTAGVTGAASQGEPNESPAHEDVGDEHEYDEALPTLQAAVLREGETLQVVATTSIVADVVAQVGGNLIALTTLLPLGADAHSFEATPQDLVTMSDAHVLFMNGLGLETSLESILDTLDGAPVVSVNVGVHTLAFGQEPAHDHEAEEHEEHEAHEAHGHAGVDPHTWFSVQAVAQWVENIGQVLSELDPTHADAYHANALAYLDKLTALETELDALAASLPVEKRRLVTDHESLGYLAATYNFEIVGAVIPSFSTVASPSAQELAALQDQIVAEGVPAIFVGMSANPAVVKQIAQDIGVQVVPIYVESLSEPGGAASSYLDFMRSTMRTIVDALT